jgi:glycosyltransferase involved in cell wall biosynthesis
MSLRILLVSDHTYLPDRVGGRESSIHDLATRLLESGYGVEVLANRGEIRHLPKNLWKRAIWHAPYHVARVKNEYKTAIQLLKSNSFDLAIYNVSQTTNYLANDEKIQRRQIFYIRDVEDRSLKDISLTQNLNFIANSYFIGDLIKKKSSKLPFILYPIIDTERYITCSTREHITFINPVPTKGLELVLNIARKCRDYRFLFIEGWSLSKIERSDLSEQLSNLDNVIFMPPELNPKKIYSTTKLLLVPSQSPEAFGRVVIEAQANGIPVMATNIGGLPESVGSGGILFNDKDIDDIWIEKIRYVLERDDIYRQLSKSAILNANKYIETCKTQLKSFEKWLHQIESRT